MRCAKCGAENAGSSKFCIKCGTPMTGQSAGGQAAQRRTPPVQRNAQPAQRNAQQRNTGTNRQIPPQNNVVPQQNIAPPPVGYYAANSLTPVGQVIPDYNPAMSYRPLGMWAYFGYDILFYIPIVGIILLLVFALGGTNNINLRNYARSKFCVMIILIVFFLAMGGIGGLFGLMLKYS